MSGTVRAGLLFGLASVAAFIGSIFLGGILSIFAFVVAFGSVIALGWGAGHTAAKSATTAGSGTGRGAAAGAIGGAIHLILLMIGFVVLFNLLLSIPGVSEQVNEVLQQNPDAANVDPSAALGIGGAFLGGCLGLVNLLLMVIGGLIGGAMWRGTPANTYVGAGGSAYDAPPSGSYIPQQTNQPYGSQSATGTGDVDPSVRVYDAPNDPDRQQ